MGLDDRKVDNEIHLMNPIGDEDLLNRCPWNLDLDQKVLIRTVSEGPGWPESPDHSAPFFHSFLKSFRYSP
jgi:hypothetical protein